MIEEYTYPDGLVVRVGYDQFATNIHDDFDAEFSGITRVHNSIPSDRCGVMKAYEDLLDEIERLSDEVEDTVWELVRDTDGPWWTSQDTEAMDCLAGQLEELQDAIDKRDSKYHHATIAVTKEYGWPVFEVVIDKDLARENMVPANTPEELDHLANGIVDTYSAWAEGSVFEIEAEFPNGDMECMGGHLYGAPLLAERG